MTLYKNRYRVESTRLAHWDYSSLASYFVTICTKDRHTYFGEIVDGSVRLSPIGRIVADEWQRTAYLRSCIDLDEFVVMPNHVHGIVVMKPPDTGKQRVARRRDALARRLYNLIPRLPVGLHRAHEPRPIRGPNLLLD